MSTLTDPAYLQHDQYNTSANLAARANVHIRFSTNEYGWPPWAFDQLALRPGDRVLEVGGGPGWLWRENLQRLPAGVSIIHSDFSLGMVAEAHHALRAETRIVFANLDAQAIAFPTEAFDVVVANHMLYHVPHLPSAVAEIARVLKPTGRLCAATNGLRHLQEMMMLVSDTETPLDRAASNFGLENAPAHLSQAFAQVEIRRYADSLWVTEAQPVVDYVYSNQWRSAGVNRAELAARVQAVIDARGGFHITKDSGMAIAYKNLQGL
jgi:ubiquinone/menaquinone biosynthesis C-methylase UbiE